MLRRLALAAVIAAALAQPAAAAPITLLPGVTVDRSVQFTLHGPVAFSVITAPRPGEGNGLYTLAPELAHGTIAGGRDRLTRIERDVSDRATVVGINGDFPGGRAGPAGIVLQGGVLEHSPLPLRSSIGIDNAGTLHVDRVSFVGTWKGTGQRRPVASVNEPPAQGRSQVVLFTPVYGAAVPASAGSAEVVLQPFPAALPGTDLQSTVVAVGAGGGESIPPDGAVLQAAGTSAAALQAEAPVGTAVTVRLILPPSWAGMTSGLGGGPVLVRGGKAVFRSGEDFVSAQLTQRGPRAGIGQLADGRVILVAVDGSGPGSSVGMSNFELAQTLVRLGAVTGSAVESGSAVTAAFDGQLLAPPTAAAERPVGEGLLVEYTGVYSPPAPVPLVNGDPGATAEPLEYKVVRPSTVTAQLVGPDGVAHVVEASVAHQPGTYDTTYSSFDAEGVWHWEVSATDDLGRVSSIDRQFRYDTTLRGLAVQSAAGTATARFVLGRSASVRLRIETPGGVTVRLLPAVDLPAGPGHVAWDGRLAGGARVPGGTYVAHVFATSAGGTSDLSSKFAFRLAP